MGIPELESPMELFEDWFSEAKATKSMEEPTAMALATTDDTGMPNVRMVLLKDHENGFVFYTNFQSTKGEELLASQKAALCFYWMPLKRQIRIQGIAEPVSDSEADSYFQSRDRQSRIGAWASNQSRPMEGRFELEKRVAAEALRFPVGEVPRPPFWSGFRLIPRRMEFWQGMPFRLHQRLLYVRKGETWERSWLFP